MLEGLTPDDKEVVEPTKTNPLAPGCVPEIEKTVHNQGVKEKFR